MPSKNSLSVSVPPALRNWVDRLVDRGGYRTASAYVRELVREDRRRREQKTAITRGLEDILAEGDVAPLTAEDWTDIRRQVRARSRPRGTGRSR